MTNDIASPGFCRAGFFDTIFYMESMARPLIIAEIGTAHSGDTSRAYELIDAAAEAGADFAKFQMVYAEEILHPDTGIVRLPGGDIRLFDRFRELEVPVEFYARVAERCAHKGIRFLCTPFGLRSLADLLSLKPGWLKIASPELNHLPLVRAAAKSGNPLILSTGVSTLADIEKALAASEAAPSRTLLHCVTSYPAPEEDYNVRVLESLAAVFGVPVGISDHSLDPILVPALATACGASMIEKHICLSRSGDGLDDPIALDPKAFALMVAEVREHARLGRDGAIASLKARFGDSRVEAVLGDGVKRLAKSERDNYERTNRSLHFTRNMKKGESITERDVAILRTEKVLTPGIAPEWFPRIQGARLSRDAHDGAGVAWEDIIGR